MNYESLLLEGSELKTSEKMRLYHDELKKKVKIAMDIASEARKKGFDPKKEVEIIIAQDVASRTEGLVGPKGVAKRLREMEDIGYSKDQIVLSITKEICERKFSNDELLTEEDIADQALRTALAYQTEGITAAPIEGISKVKIKINNDGSQFLAVYFSGPIRSAGGTAQGAAILIADVVRRELNLSKYNPSESEIERMLEEVRLYKKIKNLQLPTTDDDIRFTWRNIPIMIDGDPTEEAEVGGYRNVPNIDTNRVRGGACLVLNDGLVGRSKKVKKIVKSYNLSGWEWLNKIGEEKEKEEKIKSKKKLVNLLEALPDEGFSKDAVMGRPILSDASAHGGFRLRYGHARNTGIAAIGIHPATMAVLNDFLASGTHIRTERPGKGGIVVPVNSIEGPVVKLKNGDVIEIDNYDEGVKLREEIDEILFLGDILIGFGEFIQNNYHLCPVGYNEEWWAQNLISNGWNDKLIEDKIMKKYEYLIEMSPSESEAITLSENYNVPLHPKYVPAWKYLNINELKILHKYIWKNSKSNVNIKKILEKALILHTIDKNQITIKYLDTLKRQLPKSINFVGFDNVLDIIKKNSEILIEDKIGTNVGARMARPEKSKERQTKTKRVHGLFPIGEQKGNRKTLSDALSKGTIEIYGGNRRCPKCKIKKWNIFCNECDVETELIGICRKCNGKLSEPPCDNCGSTFINYKSKYEIDVFELTDKIRGKIGQLNERKVKLLDKVSNDKGVFEILEKGILRAEGDLKVYKDGTIRYDATDAPLTHFYPYEINTSCSELNAMGYDVDIFGDELNSDDQLVELKPQDIILNHNSFTHFKKVARFVDRELKEIYGIDKFYNIEDKSDLIGKLVLGLAPHTSAGVIGRVIGFNKSLVCWAHPYWHASKRRNCDGDEDGIILLMDGLLNFSKEYLPDSRGGRMDTPLVLVVTLNPFEVDDEVFNLDTVLKYPIELYEKSKKMIPAIEMRKNIQLVENRLGEVEQFENFHFTHSTKNISEGAIMSVYKDEKEKVRGKLENQLELGYKIRAVDVNKNALAIFERHVLPDLMGNLRAFGTQKVWCPECKSKYRRIPLRGKCRNNSCKEGKLRQSVYPNSVAKYFDICEKLIKEYDLGVYHQNRLEKIKMALDSLFNIENDEDTSQYDLSEWV